MHPSFAECSCFSSDRLLYSSYSPVLARDVPVPRSDPAGQLHSAFARVGPLYPLLDTAWDINPISSIDDLCLPRNHVRPVCVQTFEGQAFYGGWSTATAFSAGMRVDHAIMPLPAPAGAPPHGVRSILVQQLFSITRSHPRSNYPPYTSRQKEIL